MLCFALIAAAFGGCGGDGADGTINETVADSATETFHALETGDDATACSHLTPRGRQTLVRDSDLSPSSQTCEAAAAALAHDYARFGPRTFTAEDVSRNGGRAQAACEDSNAVLLRKSGNEWLVEVPGCVN